MQCKSKLAVAISSVILTSLMSIPAHAALDINGDASLSEFVQGDSPNGSNDINANNKEGIINLSGELNLANHKWNKGGFEIGESVTNFTGFIASDNSIDHADFSGKASVNIASSSTINGANFTEDGELKRTYIVGIGEYYEGNGENSANVTGTITVGSNSSISDTQFAAAVFDIENEAPLPNAMNINVNGTVKFEDSSNETRVSGSFITGAMTELDTDENTKIHNAAVKGSVYIGKNVVFEGDDQSSGNTPDGEAEGNDGIIAANNALGGSSEGNITINGTVENSQIWAAAMFNGDATGNVIVGEEGKVLLTNPNSQKRHLTAVFSRGNGGALKGNVTINGQYGESSSSDTIPAINVIDASKFETAEANLVINQSEKVANASKITTVNVLDINNGENDAEGVIFTADNSRAASGNVNVTIDGYTNIDTINAMQLNAGTYAGKLTSNVTVGPNAHVNTINGVTVAEGAAFTGSASVTQTYYVNGGTIDTLNINNSESVSLASTFARANSRTVDEATYETNIYLNNGTISTVNGVSESSSADSELNVNSSGKSEITALNTTVNTLIVDTTGVKQNETAFTTGSDLEVDTLQMVSPESSSASAVKAASIKAKTVKSGETLFNGKEYSLQDGSAMNLGNEVITQGSEVSYKNGETEETKALSDLDNIVVNTYSNDNAKSLAEAVVGSAALLNQGTEFISGIGLESASVAVEKAGGNSAFGAIQSGYSEYNTGSSVDLTSVTGIVGFAKGFDFGDDKLTTAVFLDLGYGSSESHVQGTSNDADHDYYGVGLAARYKFGNGFFIDGSLRGGMAETDFDGNFQGRKADYDSDTAYFGFHIGTGYDFVLTEDLVLTPYLRYTLTWMDDDNVTLSSGDKFKIDSVLAHGLQAGADINLEVNDLLTFTAGLGYLGVWNGDADTEINNVSISSPTIEGNTGLAHVGLRINPQDSGFSCDLGATGYAGDRKGGIGSIMINYAF